MGFLDILSGAVSLLMDAAKSQANYVASEQEKILRDYEKQVDTYEQSHPNSKRAAEAREKIETVRARTRTATGTSRVRRTDEEISRDQTGTDLAPQDFQREIGVPLSAAVQSANNEAGVYILYLDGQVMKCGRAAYRQGVRWRFTQYYNLNYDKRAQDGDYWSISPGNRDSVTVSWQCCPPGKCGELEYKLFRKYGKGPWAKRAPQSCSDDSWELLI